MRLILKIVTPIFILFLILSHQVSTDLVFDCEDFSCWNGIIVGETTYNEALRLLTFVHGANHVIPYETSIDWMPDRASGIVRFTEDGISNELFINFFDDRLTIQQVISRIGNPDSVHITGLTVCGVAFAFYKDEGMVAWLTRRDSITGVYPDQIVETINLLPKDQAETMLFGSEPIEWQGYLDYCELFENQSSP